MGCQLSPVLTPVHSLTPTLAPGPTAGCASRIGEGCPPPLTGGAREAPRCASPDPRSGARAGALGHQGAVGETPEERAPGRLPRAPHLPFPGAALHPARPPPLAPPPCPAGSRPARPLPTPSPAGSAALGMLRSPGRLGLRGDSSGSRAGRRERGGRLGGWEGGSGRPRGPEPGHAEPGGRAGAAGRRCPAACLGSARGDPRRGLR